MKLLTLIAKGLTLAARTAACMLAVSAMLAVGCAEQAMEQAPVDVEQERQEHIKMMQRETGQSPAPEAK